MQIAVRPLRGARRGTEESRIKAWRLTPPRWSLLPAVRAVYGRRGWGQKQRGNHKLRSPKGVIRLLQGIRMMSLDEKGGILMDNKNENRFPLRLDDVTRWKVESWYKKDDCQSRNEFVVKAVNFYADYLAGQVNGVLPVAIQSAIDGRLGMFEDRLAQLLYKLAVETDMGLSAVLDCIQLDADYLRKLRANSVKSVKATNGLLTFEQKVKTLESSAEGNGQWQD